MTKIWHLYPGLISIPYFFILTFPIGAQDSLKKSISWYATLSGSIYSNIYNKIPYDSIPDYDTLRDVGNNFSPYLNCSFTVHPQVSFIDFIKPHITLSDMRGEIGTEIKLLLFHKLFSLDGSLDGELWFGNDAQKNQALKGELDITGSFDLVRGSIDLSGSITGEEYRENSLSTNSFLHFAVSTAYSFTSDNLQKFLTLGCEYGFFDYKPYSTGDTTVDLKVYENDHHSYGPYFDLGFWLDRYSIDINGSYVWEDYILYKKSADNNAPGKIQEGNLYSQIQIQLGSHIDLEFSSDYEFEKEKKYNQVITIDTVNATHFFINNHELGGKITYTHDRGFALQGSFLWDQQWLAALPQKYETTIFEYEIEHEYYALIPGFEFSLTRDASSLAIGCHLRIEKSMTSYEDTISYFFLTMHQDFLGLQFPFSWTWNPKEWLSFDCLGESYVDFFLEDAQAKPEVGLFLTLSLGVRF